MATLQQQIDAFLADLPHAVVGTSGDRSKYGNKVLRCYLQHARPVYPINPRETVIEGLPCYRDLASTPQPAYAVSIVTPPPVTEQVVELMGELGIEHVWMQPGAESPRAVDRARQLGMNVIAGGPCLLVTLGYNDTV